MGSSARPDAYPRERTRVWWHRVGGRRGCRHSVRGLRENCGRSEVAVALGSALVDRSQLSLHSWWSVLSWRSLGSALSAVSAGSVFSLGSAASAGSVASIGSAGSVLSIGSAGSILSIGSAGSILSIGSAGAILGVGRAGGPPRAAQAIGGCLAVAGMLAALADR